MKMKKLYTTLLLLVAIVNVKAQETIEFTTYEENGKIGLINEKGKKITTAKYDEFFDDFAYTFSPVFHEGLCSVFLADKMGFIDVKGIEVIPLEFSFANDFTVEGLAAVEKDGKWGFINKKGVKIIPIVYDKVFDFKNGQALVIKDKTVSYIDVKGQLISETYTLNGEYKDDTYLIILKEVIRYKGADDGSDDYIEEKAFQYGFLYNGTVLPNFYDNLFSTGSKKYVLVKLNEQYGIININAKEIIPPIYDEFSSFDGEYFYFWLKTKKGVIDTEGKIIIPFVYQSLSPFKEGLSRVKLDAYSFSPIDTSFGFIDENGKEVIPRVYDEATDFIDGKAKVSIGDREFYIDKTGKEIQE
jgi:hypothetical protein